MLGVIPDFSATHVTIGPLVFARREHPEITFRYYANGGGYGWWKSELPEAPPHHPLPAAWQGTSLSFEDYIAGRSPFQFKTAFKLSDAARAQLAVWLDQQLSEGNFRVLPYNRDAFLQESIPKKLHWQEWAKRAWPIGMRVEADPGYWLEEEQGAHEGQIAVVSGYSLGLLGEMPLISVRFADGTEALADSEVLHVVQGP